MKRERKSKNIDLAVLLLSAMLLLFSVYCWVKNIIQGVHDLFPKTTVIQIDMVREEDFNKSEKTETFEAKEQGQTEQASTKFGDIWLGLFHKVDELAARVDNFWYVTVCRKNDWSGLDSAVTYIATGEISSSQVLLGKDGWLFIRACLITIL
ncbi:MAG: hypothetical protein NC400_04725 [Clostridium sp.]|nr:hypothetical protein [Clostridium sp.]